MVTASDRAVVDFCLSPGHAHDAPCGRSLLSCMYRYKEHKYILMDRAYEGDETRSLVTELGYIPVVPPKANRLNPWQYNKQQYKKRNEIERYFLRLKRFRKIFTRYDKLDTIFSGFILFAIILDATLV